MEGIRMRVYVRYSNTADGSGARHSFDATAAVEN